MMMMDTPQPSPHSSCCLMMMMTMMMILTTTMMMMMNLHSSTIPASGSTLRGTKFPRIGVPHPDHCEGDGDGDGDSQDAIGISSDQGKSRSNSSKGENEKNFHHLVFNVALFADSQSPS